MPIDDIRVFLQTIRQYHRFGMQLGEDILTKYLEIEMPDCKVSSYRKTGEFVLKKDGEIVASSLEGLQIFEE